MSKRSFFFALVLLCPLASIATGLVACDDALDLNPAPHDAGPADGSDASDGSKSADASSDASSDASDAD